MNLWNESGQKQRHLGCGDMSMNKSIQICICVALIIFGILASASPLLALQSAAGTLPSRASSGSGQSTTLLRDGRLLLLGGTNADGSVATALIKNPGDGSIATLAPGMSFARAGHTATMLPNGKVLILGGIGADGKVVPQAEIFDPDSQTFSLLESALAPRVFHTATVLTDGRLAIIGGADESGNILAGIALWNFKNSQTSLSVAQLKSPLWNHTATLQADGTVLITGGEDSIGRTVTAAQLFDPQAQTVTQLTAAPATNNAPVEVVASLPADGTTEVPLDALIAIRPSKPIQVQSANETTVTLTGPQGVVSATVIPAEAGKLVFLTATDSLLPGSSYRVTSSGVTDPNGKTVPDFGATFTTAGLAPVADGEQWTPAGSNFDGDWHSGRQKSQWESQKPLQAPAGMTAVAGTILTLDGLPLPNVTLQVGLHRTRTDTTGRFLLSGISAGHQVLLIDATTANSQLKKYGIFEDGVDIKGGQTNVLPYTIWMPVLDMAHAVTIPSPTKTETVITTPLIPGLEVHLPAGAVVYDRQGKVVTQISITPIPVDRSPFPLPLGLAVPTYFTVQPGSAYVKAPNNQGARLIYPNYTHSIPGTRDNFWNYDPNVRGWYVYGKGTVNSTATQVIPDPGVMVWEFTGAMIGGHPDGPSPAAGGAPPEADPVDPATGLFTYTKTDLSLADTLPLVLTRSYRQADPNPRAFGIGTNHPYDIFISSYGYTNYYQADLILADGTAIHYVCTTGPGCSTWTTAQYQHTTTPTRFYGSKMVYNTGGSGWILTLKDGTIYTFPDINTGINSISDRYGNTITIAHDSSQRVTQVTSPSGRWIKFTYGSSSCTSCITQATDNIGRIVSYSYDTASNLTQVVDVNGGTWNYTYDSQHEMLSITDPKGIVYLQNQYDINGRVAIQTLADGSTYQFAYPGAGSMTSSTPPSALVTQTNITDPRGNVKQISFNSTGYPTTEIRAANVPSLSQTTTYAYGTICNGANQSSNYATSVTDALSRQTAFTYDCMGNRTSVTRLAGTFNAVTTSFTYEPKFNQLASITDPLQHTTTFNYDPTAGNLTSVTDALGHGSTFAYNTAGQVTSTTDAQGRTRLYSGMTRLRMIW